MAYKSIEDSRAAIRRHYYANKDMYLDRNKRRRQQLQQLVRDLKGSAACADCKKFYPYYVMDFDHLADKVGNISQLIKANNSRALQDEIKKCEVVCSNCHRMRTFARLGASL